MDINALLQRIFEHVEDGEVDKAVRACLRLSRHVRDYMNSALFLRELVDKKSEIARVLLHDTCELKEEAQKYVFDHSFKLWLDSRTLPINSASGDDNHDKNVLVLSVNEFPAEIEQCEKFIADLTLASGLGEFDAAAFTERYNNMKVQWRGRIKSINTIRSRVLNRCLNFAIQMERQLAAQRKSVTFLERAQNEVQNYFKSRSEDVYEKLQKANQLVDSTSTEDLSLLLTQIRRAIKAVADYFYPANGSPVLCSDGHERVLGDDKYLNRLQEFLNIQFQKSTSIDLLSAELEHLMPFARRLNDLASKGVHADVSLAEAQQGFLGLYMFLYNVCQRLERKDV